MVYIVTVQSTSGAIFPDSSYEKRWSWQCSGTLFPHRLPFGGLAGMDCKSSTPSSQGSNVIKSY